MTDRWADYLISAVRYNAAETHIQVVQVHADLGATIGQAQQMTRSDVVTLLHGGSSVATIVKAQDGKWLYGAEVAIVRLGGQEYIRTDADSTRQDNLGSLPRF